MYNGKLIANDTPAAIKSKISGRLLELRPTRFVQAQAAVTGLPGVLEVQTYGDKLHLFVDNVAQRKPQIAAALAAQGITHDEIREIEVRMEEAYISLVHRQAAATPERISA
jgi:ABC-type multidrug transport system ATPase subunit